MEFTMDMEQYLRAHHQELLQLIRDLCVIPAPSHHEERRAAFCKEWFENNGGEGVYIDEALNVVCPYQVTEDGPVVVMCAHTDTVFPDMEPMEFREDAEKFYCPGVCDDTANLAVMMICAKYFLQTKPKATCGILFVANSCEEGLGNLKGTRAIVARYGSRMKELITFDGASLTKVNDVCVGSHRYQITVKTEGGHSFGSFGNRNAIAYLASMINTLYSVKVPQENGSKTTYNVGIISGGTSVNTIAQEAQMLYEYRSDNVTCLAKMEQMYQSVIAAYGNMGIVVESERIGERPCGNVVPEQERVLAERMAESIRRIVGKEPVFRSGSTDCNVPMSMGIPAVCIGVCDASGVHTREEEVVLASLPVGARLCMDVMRYYFQ